METERCQQTAAAAETVAKKTAIDLHNEKVSNLKETVQCASTLLRRKEEQKRELHRMEAQLLRNLTITVNMKPETLH